jgi:hypothetical protein
MTEVLDRVSFADRRVDDPGYSILLPARERLQSRFGPILGSWKEASLPRLCDSVRLRSSYTAEPKQSNRQN